MQRALSEFHVDGIKVTVPYFETVFEDTDFINGNIDTHFLQRFGRDW
jgi:biotin carboxylase